MTKLQSIIKKLRDLPLNSKIILILIIIWILFWSIDYMIFRIIVLPSFISMEYDEGKKDAMRVKQAIGMEIYHLDQICLEWSAWDDTCKFARYQNMDYIKNNLPLEGFMNARLNLVYIIDTKGRVLWGRVVDLKNKSYINLEHFLTKTSGVKNPLIWPITTEGPFPDKKITGTVSTERGQLMISSRPIVSSLFEGPVRGSIIMGRFITKEIITNLMNQTNVEFEIIPLANRSSEKKFDHITKSISEKSPYHVQQKNNSLSVYSIFQDFAGKNLFLIKTIKDTKIIKKGSDTVRYAFISNIISFALLLVVILFIISLIIIKPVSRLTRHIVRIMNTKDLSTHINIESNDEIGHLAQNFNAMIDQVETKRKELERIAITDGLTGLYNHRHIKDCLDYEILKSLRYNDILSIIMYDIDYFKKINDTYGHQVGDEVLVRISSELKKTLRGTDMVGRYGGEEFIVILPRQCSENTILVAEKIRKNIENIEWEHPDLKVTISGGIATLTKENHSELISIADKNLYLSKENGRNRISY